MISRATTISLAELYCGLFVERKFIKIMGIIDEKHVLNHNRFYDYLFKRDYDAWFLNQFKSSLQERQFKEFLMKIHTGESLLVGTPEWNWEQREKLGQLYLKNLAEDFLKYCDTPNFPP